MDYGVGGLDLYKRLKQISPTTGITYFSDSGANPYGKLSKEELSKRVLKVIRFLKSEGSGTVIIACHSASSVAVELKEPDVIDLISYTQNSITSTKKKKVGIIGGGRTIRSQFYGKHFRKKGHQVAQRIAQPLSILIEKGDTQSQEVHKALEKILNPLKPLDVLILACTHYPVLRKEIQSFLGSNCEIIDPVDALLDNIIDSMVHFSEGKDIFYTTGNPDLMVEVAKKVYQINIDTIRSVKF